MTDPSHAENAKLNEELTCASEANQSLTVENQRMREALEAAISAFRETGNMEMAERASFGLTGNRPAPKGFKLPSSRRVS
ncbi:MULTISPECIES: hypothetical protein [unclassified Aureimonas]|uniref:hypothetical protein n=1 Tax=unclassified Aureimonas TaxID=2615206 RepID=UPI000701BAE0|nr:MULTISPECIES: hypothetical protein [unclassified Aureimonas]KQT58125.1 hypothetical protein ASG62_24735 [Aureimonas sp. Leaf427]KQT65685.1 hypothetical protein ASG54_22660 [Aureimonas sp. Leaf460]